MVNKVVNRRRSQLTGRQQQVLTVIRDFILEYGYAPAIRQIGEKLGIVFPSAVFKHVLSLEQKGYLRRVKGRIELAGLIQRGESRVRVPLAGLVPAGRPREVFEPSGEGVDVPDWMIGRRQGNIFCVRVDGKSMVDAYIDDGDMVLVERTNTASSGEMVIALLPDGSVTLKRLKIDRNRVWLIPENPEFSPIEAEEVKILGRVVGVLRKY